MGVNHPIKQCDVTKSNYLGEGRVARERGQRQSHLNRVLGDRGSALGEESRERDSRRGVAGDRSDLESPPSGLQPSRRDPLCGSPSPKEHPAVLRGPGPVWAWGTGTGPFLRSPRRPPPRGPERLHGEAGLQRRSRGSLGAPRQHSRGGGQGKGRAPAT